MSKLVRIDKTDNYLRDITSNGVISDDSAYKAHKIKKTEQKKMLEEKLLLLERINNLERKIEDLTKLVYRLNNTLYPQF